MKSLLWLVGGTVAFWALLTCPALLLWPEDPTFTWSTTAVIICLVPTALTLAWTRRANKGRPEDQLVAVMGGTTARMAFVIAAGLTLFLTIKRYEYQRFWIFVVVYYLFTLALEMAIIVRGANSENT